MPSCGDEHYKNGDDSSAACDAHHVRIGVSFCVYATIHKRCRRESSRSPECEGS
jgi:hypothetical protein